MNNLTYVFSIPMGGAIPTHGTNADVYGAAIEAG
jgi:hypothetical protein